MRKNTLFFKSICAVAVSLMLTAGYPFSVYAEDNEPENNIEENLEQEAEETVSQEEAEIPVEEIIEAPIITEAEPSSAGTEDTAEEEVNLLMIDPEPEEYTSVEGSAEGSGTLKVTTVVRPKNVVSMIVPIFDELSYDFVIDPEGLLALDPSNTIAGGNSTVFFKSGDSENTYNIFSDVANTVNKSTVPVKLSVDLTVTNSTGADLEFSDLGNVYSADVPALSFAIIPTEIGSVKDGETVQEVIPVKSEMAMTNEQGHASKEIILPGNLDNFEIVTNPTDDPNLFVQEYVAKEDCTWPTVGFMLYGSCSRDANWIDVAQSLRDGGNISITLTYSMTPIVEED